MRPPWRATISQQIVSLMPINLRCHLLRDARA